MGRRAPDMARRTRRFVAAALGVDATGDGCGGGAPPAAAGSAAAA